jgi:hypothetical protein
MMFGTHLFGLPTVSQAGLELVSVVAAAAAVVAAHLFSQSTMVWRAFHRLRVQGVEALILLGALYLPSVAPASQQDFGVTELMLSGSAP